MKKTLNFIASGLILVAIVTLVFCSCKTKATEQKTAKVVKMNEREQVLNEGLDTFSVIYNYNDSTGTRIVRITGQIKSSKSNLEKISSEQLINLIDSANKYFKNGKIDKAAVIFNEVANSISTQN